MSKKVQHHTDPMGPGPMTGEATRTGFHRHELVHGPHFAKSIPKSGEPKIKNHTQTSRKA